MRRRLVFHAALAWAATWCGCAMPAREGRGLLAEPEFPPVEVQGPAPAHPFVAQKAGFVRARFTSDEEPGARFSVRDVEVPPRHPASPLSLSGPSVLEMLSEHGTVIIGNETAELTGGAWRAVPQGTTISFRNPGDTPFCVRVYSWEARP